MKSIPLTQGKVAIVDDEDYEQLSRFRWHVSKAKYTHYARRNISRKLNKGKQRAIHMHQIIMSVLPTSEIDHINGNGLDNRKCNLRICSRSDNQHNKRIQKGHTSQYKGVSWQKGRLRKNGRRGKGLWVSHISHNNRQINLGCFNNEIVAAKTCDKKAKELFGTFALTNF